ncbi:hypothetical protein HDU67_000075 [Dinochytrium kinnereticum]|nr:hypothetical protein HDU67_000075 [Dinochytrium kinnereticum]
MFSDLGVSHVDPSLVVEVLQRSNGNCFVLETICSSLKKSMDPGPLRSKDVGGTLKIRNNVGRNELIIKDGKYLTFSGGSSIQEILEEFLPADTNLAILIQYDRLSAKFQRLLAVASCIGQTFTLRTLWTVCIRDEGSLELLGQASPESMRSLIKAEDMFNFLVPAGGRRTSVDNVGIGQKNGYRFRHVLIQKGIYNTLLSDDKECLHVAIADHLSEDALNDNNSTQILPLVIYHLEHVSGLESRKFKIYQQLLSTYHSSSSVVEGLATYLKLHQLLETKKIEVDKQSLRVIYKDAADLYLCVQDYEESKKLATIAFANLGKPVKIDQFRMISELFLHMGVMRRLSSLQETPGRSAGLENLPVHPDVESLTTDETVAWLDLLDLLNICGQSSNNWIERITLSLLYVNSSSAIASKHPIKFAICLMSASNLLTSFGMEVMAAQYFNTAMMIGGFSDNLKYLPLQHRSLTGSLTSNDLRSGEYQEDKEDIGLKIRRLASGSSISYDEERLLTEALNVLSGLGYYDAAASISYQIRASIEAKSAEGCWMYINAYRVECRARLLAGPITSYRMLAVRFLNVAREVQTLRKSFAEPCAIVHQLLGDILCGDLAAAAVSSVHANRYLTRMEECKGTTEEVNSITHRFVQSFTEDLPKDNDGLTTFSIVIMTIAFDAWADRLSSDMVQNIAAEKASLSKLASLIKQSFRTTSSKEREMIQVCKDAIKSIVLFIQGETFQAANLLKKVLHCNRKQLSHAVMLAGILHARYAKIAMAAHLVKVEDNPLSVDSLWSIATRIWNVGIGWTRLHHNDEWEVEARSHALKARQMLTECNAQSLLARFTASVSVE